jgi:hypothetical protein
MKTLLFFPLLILVTFFACRKGDKPDEVIYLNKEMKARFNFRAGSYWIYRDSLTGSEDSFIVTENREILSSSANTNVKYELMNVFVSQRYNGMKQLDSVRWSYRLKDKNRVTCELGFGAGIDYRFKILPYVSYPFQEGVINNAEDDSGVIVQVFASYLLNGKSYSEVAEIYQASKLFPTIRCTYYLNDSVGFVKIKVNIAERTSNIRKVWELTRWNIIK